MGARDQSLACWQSRCFVEFIWLAVTFVALARSIYVTRSIPRRLAPFIHRRPEFHLEATDKGASFVEKSVGWSERTNERTVAREIICEIGSGARELRAEPVSSLSCAQANQQASLKATTAATKGPLALNLALGLQSDQFRSRVNDYLSRFPSAARPPNSSRERRSDQSGRAHRLSRVSHARPARRRRRQRRPWRSSRTSPIVWFGAAARALV